MRKFQVLLNCLLFSTIIQLLQAKECLPIGCISCSLTECDACDTNYELNTTSRKCIYSKCEQFQFFQSELNSCQAICSANTIPNQVSKVCENSNKCPLSFIQKFGINKSSPIKYIVDNNTLQLFLVYSSFVNVIDKSRGSFQRQYTFDTSIISILPYPINSKQQQSQNLYLMSEHSIFLWEPSENISTQIMIISDTTLKAESSKFIPVANNSNRFVVNSYDPSFRTITLTEVSSKQRIVSVLKLELNQSFAFSGSQILIKNDDKSTIRLFEIIEASDQINLNLVSLQSSFVCGDQSIKSSLNVLIAIKNTYFMTFKQTNGIFQVTKDSLICNFISTSEIPIQLMAFTSNGSIAAKDYIAILFSNNSINFYLAPSLIEEGSFTLSEPPLDFYIPDSLTNQISLFVLPSTQSKLIKYDVELNSQNFDKFIETKSFNLLINQPKQLRYLASFSETKSSVIIIFNLDAQLIEISSSSTLMLIQDFKDKIYQNEGSITSLAYSEKLSFILSCSVDGKLLVWSAIDPYSPIFMYSIIRNGQKCTKILVFQHQFAIALFEFEINMFDILNPQDLTIIQISQPISYSAIQVSDDYIYIFKDQTLQIFDNIHFMVSDSSTIPLALTNIQFFFVIKPTSLLFISASGVISLYQLTSSISLPQTPNMVYNSPSIIQFYKVILKSDGSFRIFLNDQSKRMVILDQTLSEIFVRSKIDGYVFALHTVDEEEKFFILFKLLDTSVVYKYQSIFIETLVYKETIIDKFIAILGISQLQKRKNHVGQIGYAMIVVLPFGYMSLSVDEWWINPSDNQNGALAASGSQGVTNFGAFSYTSLQNIVAVIPNQKQDLMIVGCTSGEIRVSPMTQTGQAFILAKASSSSSQDVIVQVATSYYLGLVLVVSNAINCYSIFTDKLVETIQFSPNTGNTASVLKIYTATQSKILIACVPQELIVRDFENQYTYRFSTISSPFGIIMNYISSFYVDESISTVYFFGDGFYSARLPDLSDVQKISSNLFQFCKFAPTLVLCKVNTNQILLLDPKENLSLIQTLTVPSNLGNFNLEIDSTYSNFFAFTNIFLVYTFKGAILSTTTYSLQIASVNLYGNNIVLVTASFLYVYLRSSVSYLTSITPSGGSVLGSLFIASYNMLAYYCDEIRYGQIFLYSLDTYQQAGTISNAYTNNGIGRVITTLYDGDNTMLHYIDRYGNFQNVNFAASRTTTNTIGLEEIQLGITPAPVGQAYEFNTNNIYFHNGANVWKLNFNLMNRAKQRILKKRGTLFLKKSSSYLILDYSNTLFLYQNQKVTYSSNFSQSIIEIKELPTSGLVLLIQIDQILVYSINSQQLSQDNYKFIVKNLYTSRILLNEIDFFNPTFDRVLIINNENKIIDYDFKANIIIGFVQLESQDFISADISLKSQTEWYYIFSTNSGKYGFYNFQTKESKIYLPSLDLNEIPIKKFVQLPFDPLCFIAIYRTGHIKTLKLQEKEIVSSTDTTIQDIIISINPQITPISQFEFDLIFNRILVNFENDKVLYVFALDSLIFQSYLSFPDDLYQQITQNQNYLILSSVCQVNIYNKQNLKFIDRARRSNRNDRLLDIQIIHENVLILVFTTRIEILIINEQSVILIETISPLVDPHIIEVEVNQFDSTLQIIGVSKNGIFEKVISLTLYNLAYQSSISQTRTSEVQNCIATISYIDNGAAQNSLDFASSTNSLMSNLNYIFQVLITNQISNLSFLNRSLMQVIIRPQSSNNILNIYANSFLNIPFNVFIDSFELNIIDKGQQLLFHEKSKNITLQNVSIQNSNILIGTQFLFKNKQIVSIQQIKIENVKFFSSNSLQRRRSLRILQDDEQSTFFAFEECEYIIIENLSIKNSEIYGNFLSSLKSVQIIINNLIIQESIIASLFTFSQDQKIKINNINILKCEKVKLAQYKSVIQPIFSFIGVSDIEIDSLQMQECDEIILITTDKNYIKEETHVSLMNDNLKFTNFLLNQNKFSQSLNKDFQPHLLILQSSKISLDMILAKNNEGNIQIIGASTLLLLNSEFHENRGVIGSCIQASSIAQFQIDSSTFTNNYALATGGAIQMNETLNLQITQSCLFSKNHAEIGGAIRFVSSTNTNLNQFEINPIFDSNTASIFGKDIGTFLNYFALYQSDSQSKTPNYQKIYEGEIIRENLIQQIQFNDAQSGGYLLLQVQLFDQYQQPFTFEMKKYLNKEYSYFIQEELNSYEIDLYQQKQPPEILILFFFRFLTNEKKEYSSDVSIEKNEHLEIKGESLIYSKQFNEQIQKFEFSTMMISSFPLKIITVARLKFSFNTLVSSTGFPLNIPFRDCISGEIYQQQSSNIVLCTQCLEGTYSIREPSINSNSLSELIETFSSCKTCPSSANKCIGDEITLKIGFWRINKMSDVIIPCTTQNYYICDEQNSSARDGCLDGHVGPICEQCDVAKQVWIDERYASSIQSTSCNQCTEVGYQIIILSIGMIVITCYLISSVLMFMSNYMQNSTCVYLRQMKILPLSTSSVLDQSAFFIKSLLNYFQLSAQLFTFTIPFIPQGVTVLPVVAGQPVSKFIVSSSCMYSSGSLSEYGDERLRAISQAIYPLGIFIIIYLFLDFSQRLKRFQISKFHKYTMINVVFFFFQPDSISFFTSGLSCRKIGDHQYQAINLIIPCSDESYNYFRVWFILPNLLFWVIFPLIILVRLRQQVNKGVNLDYCTMKYKYGFFYIGFKKQYYYWEFVRVYFKMIIVLLITLLKDSGNMVYVGCIILVFLYIIMVEKIQPFENKQLLSLEILSYFILIPNIFFSQLSLQYDNQLLQLFIVLAHFGYLSYTILVIIKYKVNSQQKGANRILRIILKFILPRHIYHMFTRERFKNHFKALMRWRFIYRNLNLICEKNQIILSEVRENRKASMFNSPKRITINDKEVKEVGQSLFKTPKQASIHSLDSEMIPHFSSQSLQITTNRVPFSPSIEEMRFKFSTKNEEILAFFQDKITSRNSEDPEQILKTNSNQQ